MSSNRATRMIGRIWIVLPLFVAFATAQVHRKGAGPCKDFPFQENFNIEKYLGSWYDAQRYQVMSQYKGKCIKGTYLAGPEKGLLLGKLQYKKLDDADKESNMTTSDSFIKHHGNKFAYILKGAEPGSVDFYEVLDTDYESWSVEYQCWSDPKDDKSHYELAWILTREPNPSETILENALRVFEDLKMGTEELQKTDQSCYLKEDTPATTA